MTGYAANSDPVCAKSARHGDVQTIVLHAQRAQQRAPDAATSPPAQPIVFRSDVNSLKMSPPCP
jgi:pyrroloquinoline quinone biosynthesis protein E